MYMLWMSLVPRLKLLIKDKGTYSMLIKKTDVEEILNEVVSQLLPK